MSYGCSASTFNTLPDEDDEDVGALTNTLSSDDTNSSLLKYPLPDAKPSEHDVKRTRLVKSETAKDTIEDRIQTGSYKSFHELKDDVETVQNAIETDQSLTLHNGDTRSGVQGQISKLMKVLDNYDGGSFRVSRTNGEHTIRTEPGNQQTKQFLSLRSQVNGNAQTLFSGLQIPRQNQKEEQVEVAQEAGPGLPNGFALTDFSALGKEEDASPKQEKRLFEKSFHPVRRLKPLDLPHTARDVVRGNTLDFISNASRTDNLPFNKHDYKFTKLPTGSWLTYHQSQHDRRKIPQSTTSSDFKAALAANSIRQGKDLDADELFSSIYSSYAPSSDNAYSLVSQDDMSRWWWQQNGDSKLSRIFQSVDQDARVMNRELKNSDEFADMVANFEPHDTEDSQAESTDMETSSLMQDITDMIETLSSYQRNRTLEPVASGAVQKPSKPEFETFEMLKTQLRILISELPPYAVAKLDGDQLEELNISTRLVIRVPDYPGTGQIDDYQLRRQKLPQQTTATVTRPVATPQAVRPNYSSIMANTAGYNSQSRNYNSSVPGTAAYGIRTAQNYQTPTVQRPAYSQTPFQATTATPAYSNGPTIQQFQRPVLQNGYGSFGNNTPLQPAQQPQSQRQTPGAYGGRPTQPGYQQRAQDNAAAVVRSASPQKPQQMVNGAQQNYAPRQYQSQQNPGQQPQTPFPYQRQSSGTPTTPVAPATLAARYDGAVNRPPSAPPGANPPQAHQSQAQTVEVLR